MVGIILQVVKSMLGIFLHIKWEDGAEEMLDAENIPVAKVPGNIIHSTTYNVREDENKSGTDFRDINLN